MIKPSIWELESFYAPHDVIIAGGGLAGLWSAYYLKKLSPSLKILVIEKNLMPTGASTRNAGFACFGSVTELMDDAKESGKETMLKLVSMRYEGIKRIEKIFTHKEIDFETRGGYELITERQYGSRKEIKKDINWLNDCLQEVIPGKKIFQLADRKIDKFNFELTGHLIENKLEGQLHPGKMVQALIQKIQAMGALYWPGIELKAYESKDNTFILETDPAIPLTTSQLLICTNGFATESLSETPVIPARGQVLVTSPIKDLPFKGTFHYDEGFYYFRNLGNRVLLGGARNKAFEDEQTIELDISETIQQELERYLRECILPDQDFTIDHRWSGIMGMGTTKFPTIREISPNCFCLVGLGGIGVALSPKAGEKVARMMIETAR